MLAKTHEDTSTYSNFFITPMAFFSGTFFPLDKMPDLLRYLIYCMPLTHTNILIRKASLDTQALVSLGVIVVLALVFFIWGSRLIRASGTATGRDWTGAKSQVSQRGSALVGSG